MEAKYLENTREIELIPLTDGEIVLQITDLCLLSKPASIALSIISVSIIRVEMSDKVEIGKCISCTVRLYDENDNLLTLPDLDMIDLRVRVEPDIAVIRREEVDDGKEDTFDGKLRYIITGNT